MSVEQFVLGAGESRYGLAFAVRVGVLDGRHPEDEATAMGRLAQALTPEGRQFIEDGDPLREIFLSRTP